MLWRGGIRENNSVMADQVFDVGASVCDPLPAPERCKPAAGGFLVELSRWQ